MNNAETIQATIAAAAKRAVDYWGTDHDEEDVILAELAAAGLTVSKSDFADLVEPLVAIADADSTRDLSAYDWSANPDFSELSAFVDQQEMSYAEAFGRVVDGLTGAEVLPFPVRALQAA